MLFMRSEVETPGSSLFRAFAKYFADLMTSTLLAPELEELDLCRRAQQIASFNTQAE